MEWAFKRTVDAALKGLRAIPDSLPGLDER
jgi:hypothetical protein